MTAENVDDTVTRRALLERLVAEGRAAQSSDPAATSDDLYDDRGLPA